MKTSDHFVVGKHSIGYVSSDFKKRFGDTEFEERPMPTFQKLPRSMTDATIESELKPGFCELGDILAFLDSVPAECKDGWANLFYTPSFVVSVGWGDDGWDVGTWSRVGSMWSVDYRVFSPAAGPSTTKSSALEPSDTSTLERAIGIVVMAGYKVSKE